MSSEARAPTMYAPSKRSVFLSDKSFSCPSPSIIAFARLGIGGRDQPGHVEQKQRTRRLHALNGHGKAHEHAAKPEGRCEDERAHPSRDAEQAWQPAPPADIGADRRQHGIAGAGRSRRNRCENGKGDNLIEAHVR